MRVFCRRTFWWVALSALAVGASSCAVPAWLAAQFAPPRKVPPEFEPPKGKVMLVLADDNVDPVGSQTVKTDLTRMLNELLVTRGVAGKTVSYDRLADLALATPGFSDVPSGVVGRKLGADLVLYVLIDEFRLQDEAAAQLWRGRLRATVRLIDVNKGRLWPMDRPAGFPVPAVETPTTTDSSPDYAEQLTRTLAGMLADKIANLFREHEVPYEGAWTKDKGE